MTEEPRWPTVNEHPATDYDQGYNHAIEACRAAWRLVNDEPAASPLGEVRQNPKSGNSVIFIDHEDYQCWMEVQHGNGGRIALSHDQVKGWPVIGAVPGTAAAKAKP